MFYLKHNLVQSKHHSDETVLIFCLNVFPGFYGGRFIEVHANVLSVNRLYT